jgi:hypothetical protein
MTTLVVIAVVALAAAVATQLLIPRIAARRVEASLLESGGEAEVTITALPAIRLLWRDGDRIEVRGRRITVGMSGESGGLAVLDRFDEVDIALAEFTTGPFDVIDFELTRRGPGAYTMRSEALTSGGALLGYGGEQVGYGVSLLGMVARQAPLGERPIPIAVEVELASERDGLRVISGGGRVAGYPAGPIASMIAAAVARRLEIAA